MVLLYSCNASDSNTKELKKSSDFNTQESRDIQDHNDWIGEMLIQQNFWIRAYKDTINDSFLVLLTSRSHGNGHSVIDSLCIPIDDPNDWIDYGTVQKYGKPASDIVVKLQRDDETSPYTVAGAWRANILSKRFEPVSTSGLEIDDY